MFMWRSLTSVEHGIWCPASGLCVQAAGVLGVLYTGPDYVPRRPGRDGQVLTSDYLRPVAQFRAAVAA